MNNKDKQKYIERYTYWYNQYGYSPQSLGWGKDGRQDIRFKVLSQIGITECSSVLDVGCGFGDFSSFLKGKGWSGKYLGIDIVDKLLIEARKQHKEIEVKNLDILETKLNVKYDFVIASGIFNAKLSYQDNWQYIQKMLQKMFEISNIGVAVDFMSTYVDYQNDTSYHTKPENIFAFAKTLSKRVLLRHDYMPYEFAVYIYQDDHISENNIFEKYL